MPTSNRAQILALLEIDRVWSAYALGDLAPGYAENSEWHCTREPAPALILVYRAFETPVLFALGPPEAVSRLLDEVAAERAIYLSVRPDVLSLIKARYRVEHETRMWRMALDPGQFRPADPAGVERLRLGDLPALEALYADGAAAGEAPDFFAPSMLEQGVFYGIRDGGVLVAAAGTHLVVLGQGVAAIGNVYTRRDQRGQGLGRRATSAVAADLLRLGLRTVVLNVNQANQPAVRMYEGLGFVTYCEFYEGVAVQ